MNEKTRKVRKEKRRSSRKLADKDMIRTINKKNWTPFKEKIKQEASD